MKRNTPPDVLKAILHEQVFFCMVDDAKSYRNQQIVRYAGKAKKRIESPICRIKRGEPVVGLRLDDGTWFIMPAGDDEWRSIVGVPDECVDMSNPTVEPRVADLP